MIPVKYNATFYIFSKRDLLGSSETTTVTLMVIFHDQLIPAQGNLRRSVAAIKSEKIEDDWHTGDRTILLANFSLTMISCRIIRTRRHLAK